ncbi:MAG: hypothetical protein RR272_03115 [Synergistaceae bacterium]
MANINPVSTSLRMVLNLGEVDGKVVEKTVSLAKVKDAITGDQAKSLVATLSPLLEPAVIATKKYSTGLLVE